MLINLAQRPKRRTTDRPSQRTTITSRQAKREAIRLLSENRLSSMADYVIELLSIGGVLTGHQLRRLAGVTDRTLRRYYRKHFIDRTPFIGDALLDAGFRETPLYSLRTYTLGAVGIEIARLRHERGVSTGYVGYGVQRILHDVMCNEVVIRLSAFAAKRGYEALWFSKYEATVHDERGKPALEPDSLLVLKKEGNAHRFLIELHNEDHGGRAANKVNRYERVYRDGHWRIEWETDEMPIVLVVFRHKAVATKGYRKATTDKRGNPRHDLRCVYLGKPWQDILKGNLEQWWRFNTSELVSIFEGV